MSDEATLRDEAVVAVLERIAIEAKLGVSQKTLQLAEAYPWLTAPQVPHGGGAK